MGRHEKRCRGLYSYLKTTRSHPIRVLAVNLVVVLCCVVLLLSNEALYNGEMATMMRSNKRRIKEPETEFERMYKHVLIRDCAPSMPAYGGGVALTQVGQSHLTYFTFTPVGESPLERVEIESVVKVMASFNRPGLLLNIGSTEGHDSFPILSMQHKHSVIQVESTTDNVDKLCRTALLNGLNNHERFTLVLADFSDKSSQVHTTKPTKYTGKTAVKAWEEVKHTIIGDEFLEIGQFRPDVINIDTLQGDEIKVLIGLRRYLRYGTPLVIVKNGDKLGMNSRAIHQIMVRELAYTAFQNIEIVDIDGKLGVSGRVVHDSGLSTYQPVYYYWKA